MENDSVPLYYFHMWKVVAGGLAAAVMAVAPVVAVAQSSADPAEPTFTKLCVDCHSPERIVSDRRTRAQWEEVIDRMTTKGAVGSDEDFAAVLGYLLRRHGRVNVNKATTSDMVVVLAIPSAEADAIVAFRKANGPFADFDALAKVPNLDVDQLSHERDALSF